MVAAMTVAVQTIFTASTANGVTTVFPYSFKITDEADLAVTVDGVLQTSGYTVSGVGSASGNVTFATAPANGAKVVRYLAPILKRETDYQQFGDWTADIVDMDFDRLWLALQAKSQDTSRSIKLPIDTAADQTIEEDAATRSGKFISFDGDGNVTLSVLADLTTLSSVPAFIATLLDDSDAAAARATLELAGVLPSEAATLQNKTILAGVGNTVEPTVGKEENGFRLTLSSGVPVTTADVTGATTIYCTPYKGNRIALYDGTRWVLHASAEFSLAIGTLTSGRPYDVFCHSNAGTPTLEVLAWTNDSTRATALAYQDGVLVKSGAATRRYLGTFYTTSTTTTEDSVANRYLWNYYHRASRRMYRGDSTVSWTYSVASWRQANNSSANQLNCVVGVSEDVVSVSLASRCSSGGANSYSVLSGIGADTTTAISGPYAYSLIGTVAPASNATMNARLEHTPAAGRHYYSWLEYGNAGTTCTWYGNPETGLQGMVLA